MSPASLAERIKADRADIDRGEAAVTVAAGARDRADAVMLLEALDLGGAQWRWTGVRIGRLIVTRCHLGAEFTHLTVGPWVPARAKHLIGPAFTAMVRARLITRTGRYWQDPQTRQLYARYRLTGDGERLSAAIAPMPGMGLLTTKIV